MLKKIWRGYLLGFFIGIIRSGYIAYKLTTVRPIKAIKGFDGLQYVSLKGDTLNIKKVNAKTHLL